MIIPPAYTECAHRGEISCLNLWVRIAPNVYAEVDYVLEDELGEVLDDSTADDGQPLRYVHGYGMLVPGLEKRLEGLDDGARAEVVVPPEEAYGLHDDELVYAVDRELAPAACEGDEIVLENEEGDERVTHVVEVGPEEVILDGNHPLAGLTLRYRLVVRAVRSATEDEIERAATAFDEQRVEHDMSAAPAAFVPLLSLTRRNAGRPN
jgi:FKBP-type peptidyl-prolyl cis-trans isomerase SlyD